MDNLLEKFPGLARYSAEAGSVSANQDAQDAPEPTTLPADPFRPIFLDALQKTDTAARERYCGAYLAGMNFLEWARVNAASDFAEYQDLEAEIDALWVKKVPENNFIAGLRRWAGGYLYLAERCHQAVIAEINRELPKSTNETTNEALTDGLG